MNPWIPWIAGSVAIMAVVAACRGTAQDETENVPAAGPDPVPLAATELVKGNLSSVRVQEVAIARSADEWLVLWRRHGGLQLPGPEMPDVDFESDMVIAMFLGERPTGGFGVHVRAVDHLPASEEAPERVVVTAVETKPLDEKAQPQVVVTPFHMVMVPQCAGSPELRLE